MAGTIGQPGEQLGAQSAAAFAGRDAELASLDAILPQTAQNGPAEGATAVISAAVIWPPTSGRCSPGPTAR